LKAGSPDLIQQLLAPTATRSMTSSADCPPAAGPGGVDWQAERASKPGKRLRKARAGRIWLGFPIRDPSLLSGCGLSSDYVQRRGEDAAPVIAAMGRFDQVFRMGHHAEHISLLVDHAGDVVDRAVRIGSLGVAEDDLAIAFDLLQGFLVREVVPVVMGDGAADDLDPWRRRG